MKLETLEAAKRAAASSKLPQGPCFYYSGASVLDVVGGEVAVGILESKTDGHLFLHAWLEVKAEDAAVDFASGVYGTIEKFRSDAKAREVRTIDREAVLRIARETDLRKHLRAGRLPREFAVALVAATGFSVRETESGSVVPA